MTLPASAGFEFRARQHLETAQHFGIQPPTPELQHLHPPLAASAGAAFSSALPSTWAQMSQYRSRNATQRPLESTAAPLNGCTIMYHCKFEEPGVEPKTASFNSQNLSFGLLHPNPKDLTRLHPRAHALASLDFDFQLMVSGLGASFEIPVLGFGLRL